MLVSKVAQRRLSLGVTQEQAARAAEVSLSYFAFIERGLVPGTAIQKRVAKALLTTTDTLWSYGDRDTRTTPDAAGPTIAELRKREDER